MAEAAVVYTDPGLSGGPLVTVSFQKNTQRKLKFLEGEPKALGITQICLIVFHTSCVASLMAHGVEWSGSGLGTPCLVSSVFVFIAGSVAIAARNLHLPTIKACLGLEIVATLASVINLYFTFILMVYPETVGHSCYYAEGKEKQSCMNVEVAQSHLFAELIIVQLALVTISVTLACYAGKVVNCCCPPPKVPVIVLQASPAAQTDAQ